MKRQLVLGVLIAMGAASMVWRLCSSRRPVASRAARGRGREAQGQPLHDERHRRRRQQRRLHHVQRRHGGGHQEPRLGAAAPRQDQDRHRQADRAHHQHAHARGPRERQRRVPGHGGSGDAGKHRQEHAGDAGRHRRRAPGGRGGEHLQAEQRQGAAEEDVQGQDEDRLGRRRSGPLLLRPRPHQRRRLGRVPGAAGDARGRHLLGQEHPAARRQQRRQRRGDRRHARQGGQEREGRGRRSSPGTAR